MRAIWIALVAGLAACGGQFQATIGDAGPDAAAGDGGGGGDGGGSPVCPSTPPQGACTREGLVCEYGDSPYGCNDLYECVQRANGSVWVDTTAGAGACAIPADGGACPATYASVPNGQACQPETWRCGYPQGTCFCALPSGPVPPPGTPPHWACVDRAAGCPETRPLYGTPCSTPSLDCDYGACIGGTAVTCDRGVWQPARSGCPAAAGGG